jgi:hypothetical protein
MPIVEDEPTPRFKKESMTVDPDTPLTTERERKLPPQTEKPRTNATKITPDTMTEDAKDVTTATQGAIVTPSEISSSNSDDEEEASQLGARRTLFASPKPSLVTPSKASSKRKASTDHLPPVAKRRLIFGKYVDLMPCQPNVTHSYKIIRKLTGSIGGNGYCGPIYGELTMGSMQKMINLMMEHTNLNSTSRFIDVGSGIGKPNIHVAQFPGVQFSCGVEMEHTRWSLGMTCLKAILDVAVEQQQTNDTSSSLEKEEIIQGNCVFLHTNINKARTFDPFTHVYMFSIGKQNGMATFGRKSEII